MTRQGIQGLVIEAKPSNQHQGSHSPAEPRSTTVHREGIKTEAETLPASEDLFREAGYKRVDHIHWKSETLPTLRKDRLFLLMRQKQLTQVIRNAISDTALASWWLSGSYKQFHINLAALGNDTFWAYCQATPEGIEREWQRRLQEENAIQPHSIAAPTQQQKRIWTSTEAIAEINPREREAFDKALRRAAKAFRHKGCQEPEALGGAGKGWALIKLGEGGHRGSHLLTKTYLQFEHI
jgi:hypothetical protein